MASKAGVVLGIAGALLAMTAILLAGNASGSLKAMRLSIENRQTVSQDGTSEGELAPAQTIDARTLESVLPGRRSSGYEPKTVQRSSDRPGKSQASFRLSFPEFTDEGCELVNSGVMRKICKLLDVDISPDEAADAFIEEHAQFATDFPDSQQSWNFNMNVKHGGSVGNVVCMELSHQGYTGGARGNYGAHYVLLDKTTGLEVDWTEMIVPGQMGEFAELAERAFRKERGLAADANLNDAGYWFKGGQFTLDAAEVGFADQGVVVHFNTYTVAPYALGATTCVIPTAEMAGIVDIKGAVARAGMDPDVF